MSLGKRAFSSPIIFLTPSRRRGVGAGRLEHGHERARTAVETPGLVVGECAELDPRDVLEPHRRAVGGEAHDDVAELLGRDQPARERTV